MDDDILGLFAHELMHEWIGGGVLSASPAIPDGRIRASTPSCVP